MKYYIKCDIIYVVILLLPALISILIIKHTSPKLFDLKDLIKFIFSIYIPFLLLLLICIYTTFIKVNDRNITINYIGIIAKEINYKDILYLEENDEGFGLFALSKDKIIITTNNTKYLVSPKNKKNFLKELSNKVKINNKNNDS